MTYKLKAFLYTDMFVIEGTQNAIEHAVERYQKYDSQLNVYHWCEDNSAKFIAPEPILYKTLVDMVNNFRVDVE